MATKRNKDNAGTARELAHAYCGLRQQIAASIAGKPADGCSLQGGLAAAVDQVAELLATLGGEPEHKPKGPTGRDARLSRPKPEDAIPEEV